MYQTSLKKLSRDKNSSLFEQLFHTKKGFVNRHQVTELDKRNEEE
jgi:hypothetical protein